MSYSNCNTPTTPRNIKREPAISTPLSFNRRLAAEQIRSSPLRIDLMKERLLGESPAAPSPFVVHSAAVDKDEGTSVDGNAAASNNSGVEFEAVHAEFEQRNIERDEILASCKQKVAYKKKVSFAEKKAEMHQETTRHFRLRVASDDIPVIQQMTLLKRYHADEMSDKQRLISQLTSVIRDLELQNERMKSLRSLTKGLESSPSMSSMINTPTSNTNVTRLVEHIERLQSEKADLTHEIVELKLQALSGTQAEFRALRDLTADLEKEKSRLEEDVSKLHSALATQSVDTERRTRQMESEIERLGAELRQANNKIELLHSASSEACPANGDNDLRRQLSTLIDENLNLRCQLVAARAKSPEVVTKIRHLGELNLGDPEETARLKCQLSRSVEEVEKQRLEVDGVRQQLASSTRQLESVSLQLEASVGEVNDLRVHLRSVEKQLVETTQRNGELMSDLQAAQLKIVRLESDLLAARSAVELKALVCQLNASVTHSVTVLRNKQRQLTADTSELRNMASTAVQQTVSAIASAVDSLEKRCTELKTRYRHEVELRKAYHNELIELKGNIRVLCRVRPVIAEDGPVPRVVVSVDPDDDSVVKVLRDGRPINFDCDRAFSPRATQEEVFAEVRQLVTSCADGYNVSIFAYGQTGSGKTFTMEGLGNNWGINYRTMLSLFAEVDSRKPDWSYVIQVSALEIYNENIRDLLGNSPMENLEIKMLPEGGLQVAGLTWITVADIDSMNKIFVDSRRSRVTAATVMNERSSRSHALFCATVVGTNSDGTRVIGKLNLVDLAGSERVCKSGAEGDRLKEAQHINKSLSSLGDVIHALQTRQSHVPYRNSRLTYLLQDCLGGQSKTLMVMQVSPVLSNVSETVATLTFAQRVRSVELGQAKKRMLPVGADGTSGKQTPAKTPRRK